jgi:F-type H+-transporting ATPase subunit b
MDLTPDFSLVTQIVLFVALWMALKRLVFIPMQQALATRELRTVAAQDEAVRLQTEAQTAQAEYEEALRRVRVESAHQAAAARNTAQDESQRALADARAAAAAKLLEMRAEVSAQVDLARRSLAQQAASVAEEMLARIFGGARP